MKLNELTLKESIGALDKKEITLEEIEEKSGRLTYEVLSLIPSRVTKVYVEL